MQVNKIYNEDCFNTLDRFDDNTIDIVVTSPPYNTSRSVVESTNNEILMKCHSVRYDMFIDNKTSDEYCQWTVDLFNKFDKKLKSNGVVLYNISYGSENPNDMWFVISDIIRKTNFMVADCIIWKKKSALPQNVSPNKLTRICEFVFVLCRKDEYMTYKCNKAITSVRETGQKMYGNIFNFIDSRNNDESCPYNKATYSSDLVLKLLNIYGTKDGLVYDPFMGSGTTAVGCVKYGCNYVGSEISENQVRWAENRISSTINEVKLF